MSGIWSVESVPLLVAVLVVWRVTHLFSSEDGPWQLLVRFRNLFGDGFWGELLDCFYCLSLWFALPLALFLGSGWPERLLLWPALSAGAILLERLTEREELPSFVEESTLSLSSQEENQDGLLR